MKKGKVNFSFQNFLGANGPLRCIILVLNVIVLGLAVANFTSSIPEIYFLIVILIVFVLSVVTPILSFLDIFKRDKITHIDWIIHLYASLFLLNSSISQLIFSSVVSESDTAVRVVSGVFGMLNAFLIAWLAYLTHSGKESFPCRQSSNEVNEVDEDIQVKTVKAKPILLRSKVGQQVTSDEDWSWRKALTCQLIGKRFKYDLIFDGSTKEARLFTLMIGFVTILFAIIPRSTIYNYLSEQYFITMTCLNFCVTFLFHLFYLLGISKVRIVQTELRIFDKSFHLTGGLFQLVGGILMLGSTIESSYLAPPGISVHERTFLAVLGIFNGILYGYIGLRQKWRAEQNSEVTTTVNDPEGKIQQLPSMDDESSLKFHSKDKRDVNVNNKKMTQRPSLIFDPSKT